MKLELRTAPSATDIDSDKLLVDWLDIDNDKLLIDLLGMAGVETIDFDDDTLGPLTVDPNKVESIIAAIHELTEGQIEAIRKETEGA
ncbi:MAG: hypothetical protein ABID64_00900 [Nitrospirota bacterium]